MSKNHHRAVGAMHPILFFIVVYGIALFMAFFVCHVVYNNLHPEEMAAAAEKQPKDYVLAQSKPDVALQ